MGEALRPNSLRHALTPTPSKHASLPQTRIRNLLYIRIANAKTRVYTNMLQRLHTKSEKMAPKVPRTPAWRAHAAGAHGKRPKSVAGIHHHEILTS